VIVVDGVGEMGQVGRVIDIAPDGIVTFQPVESLPSKAKDKTAVPSTTQNTPVSLPMADLSICFQCGDWVEVTHGPHAQQKGFIISLRAGGVAEVYDVSRDFVEFRFSLNISVQAESPKVQCPYIGNHSVRPRGPRRFKI
jgi:hypothetical protein